jgi:hypothetical protein
VIIKLDISNVFVSLYVRLILDTLSGKTLSDYECGILGYELREIQNWRFTGIPEFLVFCLVTLNLWGRIFKNFPLT